MPPRVRTTPGFTPPVRPGARAASRENESPNPGQALIRRGIDLSTVNPESAEALDPDQRKRMRLTIELAGARALQTMADEAPKQTKLLEKILEASSLRSQATPSQAVTVASGDAERIRAAITTYMRHMNWHPGTQELEPMMLELGPFETMQALRTHGSTWLKAATDLARDYARTTVRGGFVATIKKEVPGYYPDCYDDGVLIPRMGREMVEGAAFRCANGDPWGNDAYRSLLVQLTGPWLEQSAWYPDFHLDNPETNPDLAQEEGYCPWLHQFLIHIPAATLAQIEVVVSETLRGCAHMETRRDGQEENMLGLYHKLVAEIKTRTSIHVLPRQPYAKAADVVGRPAREAREAAVRAAAALAVRGN